MEDEHLIEHENLYKTKIMVIFLFKNAAENAAISSFRKYWKTGLGIPISRKFYLIANGFFSSKGWGGHT